MPNKHSFAEKDFNDNNLTRIGRYKEHMKKYDVSAKTMATFIFAVVNGELDTIKSLFEELTSRQKIGLLNRRFDFEHFFSWLLPLKDFLPGFGLPFQIAKNYGHHELSEYLNFQKLNLEKIAIAFSEGAADGALNNMSPGFFNHRDQKALPEVCKKIGSFLPKTGKTEKDAFFLAFTCRAAYQKAKGAEAKAIAEAKSEKEANKPGVKL